MPSLALLPLGLLVAAAGAWLLRNPDRAAGPAREMRDHSPVRPPAWVSGPGFRRAEVLGYQLLGALWIIGGLGLAVIVLLFHFGILHSAR